MTRRLTRRRSRPRAAPGSSAFPRPRPRCRARAVRSPGDTRPRPARQRHRDTRIRKRRLDAERRLRGDPTSNVGSPLELRAGRDDLLHQADPHRLLGADRQPGWLLLRHEGGHPTRADPECRDGRPPGAGQGAGPASAFGLALRKWRPTSQARSSIGPRRSSAPCREVGSRPRCLWCTQSRSLLTDHRRWRATGVWRVPTLGVLDPLGTGAQGDLVNLGAEAQVARPDQRASCSYPARTAAGGEAMSVRGQR